MLEDFSDEEVNISLNRELLKVKNQKAALVKVKQLEKHISHLKTLTLQGMDAIVDTMIAVDEGSKKMAFSHFDQQDTNILGAQSAEIVQQINEIAASAQRCETKLYNSDDIDSNSDGNRSAGDEINMIVNYQKMHEELRAEYGEHELLPKVEEPATPLSRAKLHHPEQDNWSASSEKDDDEGEGGVLQVSDHEGPEDTQTKQDLKFNRMMRNAQNSRAKAPSEKSVISRKRAQQKPSGIGKFGQKDFDVTSEEAAQEDFFIEGKELTSSKNMKIEAVRTLKSAPGSGQGGLA